VDVEVRAKAARDQMGVIKDIHKALGGSTTAPAGKKKTTTNAEMLELEGTEKLVSEAKAEFLKAVQKPFDLVRQLLIGEARTQWDKIVKEMFDRDTWVGVNGKTHDGPRMRTWKSLTDCIELHKHMVLPADAAEKQVVRKPQCVTIRQYMLHMGKSRANEIASENSKTGKVTAVVAVIYLLKDKLCNSRSAKQKPLAKDCQKLANKSKKSKRLARICQNVALRDDLAKDRGKASQTGTSESHDDVSTDLLFMQKEKIDILIVKRAVPQSWNTSNGTFQTKRVGNIELSFVDYSTSKRV